MFCRTRTGSWHASLAWLLVAVVSLAPVARAACDIASLSGAGHSDQYAAAATAGVATADALDGDWCCADLPDSLTEHTRPAPGDYGLVPSTPTPALVSSAPSYQVARAARPAEAARRTALPPVERVFRRAPKLLI